MSCAIPLLSLHLTSVSGALRYLKKEYSIHSCLKCMASGFLEVHTFYLIKSCIKRFLCVSFLKLFHLLSNQYNTVHITKNREMRNKNYLCIFSACFKTRLDPNKVGYQVCLCEHVYARTLIFFHSRVSGRKSASQAMSTSNKFIHTKKQVCEHL